MAFEEAVFTVQPTRAGLMKRRFLGYSAGVFMVIGGLGAGNGKELSLTHVGRPSTTRTLLTYHRAWTAMLHANADSTAVVERNAPLGHGMKGMVVVVIAGNNVFNCNPLKPVKRATTYAFEANTGRVLWKRSTMGRARCTTAAPAVSGKYVYSPGLDGQIHKYLLGNGREYRRRGWPKRFTRMPYVEKESANLVVSGHFLYATTSGFTGDAGHYEGHLVTISLRSGRRHVFNSLCSHIHRLLTPTVGWPTYCPFRGSGMWGRGQASIDPLNGDVYVVTGNGPWNGRTNWGDSVLKLDPSGWNLLDAFTPTNQAYLNSTDNDLGSSGSAVLPAVRVNRRIYTLLVQAGKGPATSSGGPSVLWLLRRHHMGARPRPGHPGASLQHIESPGGCKVRTAPAIWRSHRGAIYVFYANDCAMSAYRLKVHSVGGPKLVVAWSVRGRFTTPIISASGLYVARAGAIQAYVPASGRLIWSSHSSGSSIGPLHWEYPCVASRMLFMTDETGKFYAFRRRKSEGGSRKSEVAGPGFDRRRHISFERPR